MNEGVVFVFFQGQFCDPASTLLIFCIMYIRSCRETSQYLCINTVFSVKNLF